MSPACFRDQVNDLLRASDGHVDVDADDVRPGPSYGTIHGVVTGIVSV